MLCTLLVSEQLTVIWQTVIVTVTLSVADISTSDTFVFTPVSHHAVFQRETSMTYAALERSLTCTFNKTCSQKPLYPLRSTAIFTN